MEYGSHGMSDATPNDPEAAPYFMVRNLML